MDTSIIIRNPINIIWIFIFSIQKHNKSNINIIKTLTCITICSLGRSFGARLQFLIDELIMLLSWPLTATAP